MNVSLRLSLFVILFAGLCFTTGCNQSSPSDSADSSGETETEVASSRELESPEELLKKVEQAIEVSQQKYLESEKHSPWEIFHGILAFRKDYKIKKDGQTVNALE